MLQNESLLSFLNDSNQERQDDARKFVQLLRYVRFLMSMKNPSVEDICDYDKMTTWLAIHAGKCVRGMEKSVYFHKMTAHGTQVIEVESEAKWKQQIE